MRAITVLSFIFLSTAVALANAASWHAGAREDWVQSAPAPYSEVTPSPNGPGLLLHDRQIRITTAGDDRYEHWQLRLTAAQSGDRAVAFRDSVDPRFQELVLHTLRLLHPGAAPKVYTAAQIGRLLRSQSAQAEPRQRELDPRLQLSLPLPEAQAGDVLDCDYTVHTRTALYPGLIAGHYAARWSADPDQPLQWERLRVSWPPERGLQFRIGNGGGLAPRVLTRPGELDIQWTDTLPVTSDTDTPRWFERQSLVQLSDFGDWTQVSALLAPRYAVPQPPQPPLPLAADAVPGMILNALRLVQDKVHPIAGIGSGPYLPADPDVLLQRGYGDARDLARLLTSLLQRLGIDAQVALADSRRGAVLATSLPSPVALDSALVAVRVGERQYWLDPAAPGPAAALDTSDPADLRNALMIADSGGRIIALPPPPADSRRRSVQQEFDLRAGPSQPAALTVTTRYQGSWTQAMRAQLAAQNTAQLQLSQIQVIAQDYPAATSVGDVQLRDSPDGSTFEVTARFRLPQPFGPARAPHFDFYAESLAEVVQPRDEATRRFPLALAWPLKLEQRIDASLPRNFTVPAGSVRIETAQYRYQREVRVSQGILHITHSYESRSDHVDPQDYPKFVQANAEVTQALGLRITPDASPWQKSVQWLTDRLLIIVAALVVVGTLAIGAWRRLRRR